MASSFLRSSALRIKAGIILGTALLGWACTALAIFVLKDYAFTLFIWLPLVMGATSTIGLRYFAHADQQRCLAVGLWSLVLFCGGLLLFAFEGLICIAMAAPLGLAFVWLGHKLGYELMRTRKPGRPTSMLMLLMLSVPALMSFEHRLMINQEPALRAVTTSITISASPQEVWQQVVRFPQLPAPTELLFRAGIAYPINATITGQGVGAIRRCNFSTGSFVEPITTWNEPHLLAFSVQEQPATMQELSPYNLQPDHLHGYFISRRGQFQLTALPNGHTRLTGTTWYYNRIQPDLYWSLWSNYIVHAIHQRVLSHIQHQAESIASTSAAN